MYTCHIITQRMPALVGIAVLGIFLLTGCSSPPQPSPDFAGQNVILISLDTTRLDYIGFYSRSILTTPALQAFAKDGTVFTQAVTPAPLTVPAHTTLFTGLHPIQHGVRDNFSAVLSGSLPTLAELFQEAGYQTAGVAGSMLLAARNGFGQGFDRYVDQFTTEQFQQLQPVVERRAEEVVRHGIEWLEAYQNQTVQQTQQPPQGQASRPPFFLFCHFYDPHMRYTPPSAYQQRFPDNPYAGEIAYVDDALNRFFNYLKEQSLYENTLIIVVGDHGEGLNDHGEQTHGLLLYDEVMHVPFMVKLPGGADSTRRRVEQPVSLMDIAPTLVDLFNLGPARHAGISLRPWLLGTAQIQERELVLETQYPYTYNWSPLFALRSAEWKYIQAPDPELYNLRQDPAEQSNLAAQQPARAEAMKSRLEEKLLHLAENNAVKPEEQAVPLDHAEALASLGYAAGGAAVGGIKEQKTLSNPKTMLDVYNKIDRSLLLISSGRNIEAANLLQEVLKRDPNNPSAYFNLGRAYYNLGRWRQAQMHAQRAINHAPGRSIFAQMLLAQALLAQGNLDQGRKKLQEIIQVYPNLAQAHYLLGDSYARGQQPQQARRHFEEAQKLMPDMPGLQEAIEELQKTNTQNR